MFNECIPYYEPGQRITGHATDDIVGKTFVDISADIQSGPGLSATAEGGNIRIATADEEGPALGVASHDTAEGGKVTVILGGVVPVTAGASIDAGEEVEVGDDGEAVPFDEGRIVGRALADAASGEDAMILLYNAIAGPVGPEGPEGPGGGG